MNRGHVRSTRVQQLQILLFSSRLKNMEYSHDDVIKWKHFPRYWPFVRGIHRSRWIPHTKASDAESFDVFFDLRLNKWLSNQSWGWWFETLSCPLWRHRNAYPMNPWPPVLSDDNPQTTILLQSCRRVLIHVWAMLHCHVSREHHTI